VNGFVFIVSRPVSTTTSFVRDAAGAFAGTDVAVAPGALEPACGAGTAVGATSGGATIGTTMRVGGAEGGKIAPSPLAGVSSASTWVK
jgi:hypothetical protein